MQTGRFILGVYNKVDLLKDNIRKIYFKYLASAFGSSLVSTIYGLVDMIVIGRYEGPAGSAAMAVISPIWNIIFSLGLLFGIGGSVYFSNIRGREDRDGERENEYFTVSMLGAAFFSLVCTAVFFLFDGQILTLFGANESMIPLCRQYLLPIKFVIPTYLFSQALAAFLRNDGRPELATIGVLSGGVFNVFGDIFFTFTLDLGMFGAGLATAIGNAISIVVMCSHFFSKRNTLRLVRVHHLLRKLKNVIVTGFSSFFVDVAMGIVTALLNNQIMKYAGADALAVYGVVVYISTFVQCCGYSVGQAAQPIISANLGAQKFERIRETLRHAIFAAFGFAFVMTAISMALPRQIIALLMDATPEVLALAPGIVRTYALSFVLLPLNVFSTYYFQSLMKPGTAFGISLARGAVISGGLILLLPLWLNAAVLWLAMPITEALVCIAAVYFIRRYTVRLGKV